MRICNVSGCERKCKAYGYCELHWKRVQKHGDPQIIGSKRIFGKCAAGECIRPLKIGGYCTKHYQRVRKYGISEGRGCMIAGCNLRHYRVGLCKEHNRVAQARMRAKTQTLKAKIMVVYHYTGGTMKCMCPGCDVSHIRFLTINHDNYGGTKHRRELKHFNIYVWVVQQGYPEGYSILCYNCNCSQHLKGKICPHKATDLEFEQRVSRIMQDIRDGMIYPHLRRLTPMTM